MTDLISEQNLRHAISFSHRWERGFEDYFDTARTRRIIDALTAFHSFEVEVSLEHYGSGLASYRDIFLYHPDRIVEELQDSGNFSNLEVPGITLYVCELYPVAIWSGTTSYRTVRRPKEGRDVATIHSHTPFLSPQALLQPPPGDWSSIQTAIEAVLEANRVTVLSSTDLNRPLPFKTEIGTLLPSSTEDRDESLMVFDALFYWED